MAAGYKAGDKAYIVESNRIVRECTVVRPAGNLIIIVMKHIEENIKTISKAEPKPVVAQQRGYRSPYDYWH